MIEETIDSGTIGEEPIWEDRGQSKEDPISRDPTARTQMDGREKSNVTHGKAVGVAQTERKAVPQDGETEEEQFIHA